MDANTLKQRIILSSIPLRKIGAGTKPIGSASGCLVRYAGKLLILTVEHAVGDGGQWAVEMQWLPERRQTELFRIGGMRTLKRGDARDLNKETGEPDPDKLETIDFSYAVLPTEITPLHQNVEMDGTVNFQTETIKLETDFRRRPDGMLQFGFFGHTKIKHLGHLMNVQPRLEMGMKIVEEDEDTYVFQMQKREMQKAEYEGCSGSPILDSNGELVSLTVGVNDRDCKVRGVKLPKFKFAIDIECGSDGAL